MLHGRPEALKSGTYSRRQRFIQIPTEAGMFSLMACAAGSCCPPGKLPTTSNFCKNPEYFCCPSRA